MRTARAARRGRGRERVAMGGTARKERRVRCVAGGERGEKKNEEAMGEGAHVLLAAAIMISCGHQDGTCQAVSLSRQGQRALLPRL